MIAESCRRMTAWCRSRSSRHALSPSSTAFSVEPTMSVKRTVARTRSASTTSHSPRSQMPHRKRLTSRAICSGSTKYAWSCPAIRGTPRRDSISDVPRLVGVVPVPYATQDESRNSNRRQRVTRVDLHVHAPQARDWPGLALVRTNRRHHPSPPRRPRGSARTHQPSSSHSSVPAVAASSRTLSARSSEVNPHG